MKTLFFITFLFTTGFATAQTSVVRQKQFNTEKGIALSGYDPVSYFQKKPLKGSKSFAVTHEGISYYFANAANADAFRKNPVTYEPQYGGWCAYAMGAKGEKVEIDPETYKIINGKLYLFYNRFFNNTLTDWNKDETNLKTTADKNWHRVSGL